MINKNIDELALKILENEEIIKEILNIYEFDALCDKIKSIDPRIHREDIEGLVRNFEENSFEEINQENLEQVSGGKSSNVGRKITSGTMALLMGISPIFVSAGTRGSQKSEKAQQKASLTQKAINFVSSHKVPCELAFITTLILGKGVHSKYKKHKKDEEYKNRYVNENKENLLKFLPEKWDNFWTKRDEAEESAIRSCKDRYWSTTWNTIKSKVENATGKNV